MSYLQDPTATARAEMAERIQVLRAQAKRDQQEADNLRDQADNLDLSASTRLRIADEYEAIANKAVGR